MLKMREQSALALCGAAIIVVGCAVSEDSTPPSVDEGEQDVSRCSAVVYEHCNYRGTSVCLASDDYSRERLARRGLRSRSISSVKVSANHRVELFAEDYQSGESLTLDADESCLVDRGFNDRTVSL